MMPVQPGPQMPGAPLMPQGGMNTAGPMPVTSMPAQPPPSGLQPSNPSLGGPAPVMGGPQMPFQPQAPQMPQQPPNAWAQMLQRYRAPFMNMGGM